MGASSADAGLMAFPIVEWNLRLEMQSGTMAVGRRIQTIKLRGDAVLGSRMTPLCNSPLPPKMTQSKPTDRAQN
jgi:hypothetical protein